MIIKSIEKFSIYWLLIELLSISKRIRLIDNILREKHTKNKNNWSDLLVARFVDVSGYWILNNVDWRNVVMDKSANLLSHLRNACRSWSCTWPLHDPAAWIMYHKTEHSNRNDANHMAGICQYSSLCAWWSNQWHKFFVFLIIIISNNIDIDKIKWIFINCFCFTYIYICILSYMFKRIFIDFCVSFYIVISYKKNAW